MLQKFFEKLRPADIIGFVVIIGGFILLFNGVNGVVGGCVIAVVAYYFAASRKHDQPKNNQPH